VADFYAARDNTMPPLPWPSIAPPFTRGHDANRQALLARVDAIWRCRDGDAYWSVLPVDILQL